MTESTHIRAPRAPHASLCGEAGGSISFEHYLEALKGHPAIAGQVAKLPSALCWRCQKHVVTVLEQEPKTWN